LALAHAEFGELTPMPGRWQYRRAGRSGASAPHNHRPRGCAAAAATKPAPRPGRSGAARAPPAACLSGTGTAPVSGTGTAPRVLRRRGCNGCVSHLSLEAWQAAKTGPAPLATPAPRNQRPSAQPALSRTISQ
jgi:hypothetical protein